MANSIQKINFEPVSDILPVTRRDFALADPTLVAPGNAVALYDGEWLTLNSSYQALRASTIGSVGNRASLRSFPLFAEHGRYDVQALANKKVPVLFLGVYEANTRVYDATVSLGSGAAITAVLQPLKVATITIGSRNFSGLVGHGGSSDTDPIVGYVTRLPSNNDGKLRFMQGWRSLPPQP